MAKIILGTWMNSLRLDPLKILVEGVLRERYSLQEGVFNDYVFSFPIYLMLEFYSTIIPPVILQSPWNYFSITMGKREVALDDFLISIQISLGIMPYTFNKTIPTSFYSLEETIHHNIKTEKFQTSSWKPNSNCISLKIPVSIA